MSHSNPLPDAQPLEGFAVVGVSVMTCNKDDRAAHDINMLWQRFYEDDILHKISDRADNVIYAVYSDYEGDHTAPYRVTIGCKLKSAADDLPGDLYRVHVPAGDYAIFAAAGEQPQALITAWQNIWKMPLQRSFKADVEIYGPRFFEEGLHEVMICIGIQK